MPNQGQSPELSSGAGSVESLPGRMTRKGRVLHTLGFLVGLGLFAWAVSLAFSTSNREALQRLQALPAGSIAGLASLTALSLVLNALMFFVTARPLWTVPQGGTVHRDRADPTMRPVPILDMLTINCIATLLSLLPFKLGLLVRSMLHVRWHGTPVPALLAWLVMFGAMTLTTALLAGGLALLRGKIDMWWGVLLTASVLGIAVLASWLVPFALGAAMQLGQMLPRRMRRAMPRAHELIAPLSIIASQRRTFMLHALLRVLDFGTFGLRFALLAGGLGIVLSTEHGLLLGSTFLLLNAMAPAGSLGFAEMGVAGAGTLVGLPTEQIVLLSLLTTALQSVVAAVLGGVGWVVVRGMRKNKAGLGVRRDAFGMRH